MTTNAVTEETPAVSDSLETGFLPQDEHYRLTGEMKSDEVTTETPSEKEPASAAASETAAASEPASSQKETTEEKPAGKTSATSESRWQKLSRENRELKERLSKVEAAPRETQQVSQPAAETKPDARPKIDDVDPKTGKPKYATYGEFETAKDDWLLNAGLRKFQEEQSKLSDTQRQQHAERVLAEGMVKKFETSRTKHADFDQVALNPDLCIPKQSVTDIFLLESEHAGEVAYHLGQHPEILTGFYGDHDPKTGRWVNKITPGQQYRALMAIEAKFSGTSAKPATQAVTNAPRTPHQVSGKGTVAKDAVEQAVEDGDTETYMREANARELARQKRK